jgi:Endonuclease/Exonuclease/phosphatase family
MSKAIKLMTFNIQQLPWLIRAIARLPIVGSPGASPEPDPKGRALAVARAILDLPVRDQPDVIAFNEAFSETARPVLINRLKSKYPYIIEKLEHPGPDIEEDSGLMLFSKLPFLKLPNGDNHVYEIFPTAVSTDKLAAKGVGIVRVNGPFEVTTIAFTHLQASYDAANTGNADIRNDQIEFIHQTLLDLADGNLQDYANSVIIGDLNIKGDPDDTSGEKNLVFSNTPKTFGGDFDDGWQVSMHPPGDLTDYDPGYTHRDTPTYQPNRFDYQCTHRDADMDIGLVPHHMSIPLRLPSEVSDHWALLAHLHRVSPNCTPALAIDLLSLDPINKNLPESSVWILQTNFRDEDMFHWIYISEPGTFSIFTAAEIEATAFQRTDFTHALVATDTLSTSELPDSIRIAITEREQQVVDKGEVFSWRDPFFIRLRGVSTSFKGSAAYVIVRHRGDSPATALILHPHLAIDPGLPLGQKLGNTDECFFKAIRQDKFTGTAYADRFQLRNVKGAKVSLELRDATAKRPPLARVSNRNKELTVTRDEKKETVFLVLHRADVNDVSFSMFWDSPLTFVRLDESFRLHIDDETGPDWLGADEFDLDVDIDGDNVFSGSWNDADAGEDWPSLSKVIHDRVQARQGQGNWAAFTSAISFSIIKTDGIAAHGSEGGFIRALDSTDRDNENRTASIEISDPAGDGHLTAHVLLSKFPPS